MEGNVLVFFDGTWDGDCPEETGRGETNVPRLHRLFVEDGDQRACYLPGVGTGGVLDRMVGGLTGAGLSLRIQRGYTWLAANWRHSAGDSGEPTLRPSCSPNCSTT